jgi:3-keto-disaccharide hydrolase
MKRWFAVAVSLLIIGLAGLCKSQPTFGQATAGWRTLFNGSSLGGWNAIGNANWTLLDGAVQADQGAGVLVTKGSYGDFQLRVEFWVDEEANSGVFLRCSDPKRVSPGTAYEVNIFDQRPASNYGTGAIVDLAKPVRDFKAAGRWSTYEITAKGPRITITLNGARTLDVETRKYGRGPIGLQYSAGMVKLRKVQIRPL